MKRTSITSVIIALCAGCATSADVSYQYTRHNIECEQLTREIARQPGSSDHKKSLNQRYYRDCVGN